MSRAPWTFHRPPRSPRARTGMAPPAAARGCAEALDPFGTAIAICNCLYGVQTAVQRGPGRRLRARASTTGCAREWLDQDPRLRASIVLPIAERRARGRGDRALRRRPALRAGADAGWASSRSASARYWPIYAAAERHGLPVGIHAGSDLPPRAHARSAGRAYYLEDYAAQSPGFQAQLASLICEGVFAKIPRAEGGAARIRRHLAAGAICGGCRSSGAGCASKCPGSTARRPRSCAITCA